MSRCPKTYTYCDSTRTSPEPLYTNKNNKINSPSALFFTQPHSTPPMPKPHARATRAISPGHLPMMVRLLARISRNDLHWLNTLDARELRTLLQLIATAKSRRLNIATLLEEHNRHCTG